MHRRSLVISEHLSNRVSNRGMTVTELLVAMAVIGIAIAGITELVWVNASWSTRLLNKIDNIYAAKQFLERLGRDVRSAKNIGDSVYGSTTFQGYDLNLPMPNQTLILQIPVVDTDGYPVKLPKGSGTPATQSDQVSVDTLVYRVMPDSYNPGQNLITLLVVPGIGSSRQTINPAQTVLKGVIGPLNSITGQLATFKFIDGQTLNVVDTVPVSGINNVSGVVVNLEVLKNDSSQTQVASVGLRAEYFLRNSIIGG